MPLCGECASFLKYAPQYFSKGEPFHAETHVRYHAQARFFLLRKSATHLVVHTAFSVSLLIRSSPSFRPLRVARSEPQCLSQDVPLEPSPAYAPPCISNPKTLPSDGKLSPDDNYFITYPGVQSQTAPMRILIGPVLDGTDV